MWYVSVFDPSSNAGHGRRGLPVGPLPTREAAEALVPLVREKARQANAWADFWSFGVAHTSDDYTIPGRWNSAFGL